MVRHRTFRTVRIASAALVATPCLLACGGSESSTPTSSSPSPATTETERTTLLAGDWSRAAGTEGYTCVRKTSTEELFVNAFDAINPLGTHHTLLTMGAANGADATTPCTAADNHPLAVFGSGVGSNPLQLPKGVVIK